MQGGVTFLLAVGVCAGLLAGPAQTPAQPAAEMLRQAQREAREQNGRISLATYERILAAARAEGDLWTQAAARRGLGLTLRGADAQQAKAREHLQEALRLHETLEDANGAGWTLSELGWLAFEDGRAEEANRLWLRGVASFDAAGNTRGRAELMHNRCFALPSGPEKRALLAEGLALARQLSDLRIESQFLYKLGEQQSWDGDFASALVTLERAVAGFEQIGHEAAAARVLVPLGRLHAIHGRPERGLEIHERAYAIFERLGHREGMVQALAAMGNGYFGLGRIADARRLHTRALSQAIEIGGVRNINLRRLQLAWVYLETGEPARSKAFIDEVVATGDAFATRLAQAPLADVLFALGDYERARAAADEALRVMPEPAARPHVLALRARLQERLGRPEEALADVSRALDEIERLRPRLVQTDPMKQGFGDSLRRVFEYAVDLRARLGRHEAALEAAEQARGRAFLDLLATRHVPALAGRPELSELRRIDSEIRHTAESADGGAPDKSAFMEGLRARWRKADPELRSFVAADPFSVAQLSAAAARLKSTIAAYWVGAERSVVWVVGPDGLVASAIVPAGAARLADLVRDASDAAAGGFVGPSPSAAQGGAPLVRHSAPRQTWRALHDLLIRPVAGALPRTPGALLTIIPHGPLSRLSFAALMDERGRYLIERFALHYVPAGAVLEHTATKHAGSGTRYLLVADPAAPPSGPGGRALPPLPDAVREVGRIASALPAASVERLTGASAAEDRVRDRIADGLVLHFATHAVLHDDRSLESFLALGRGGPGADGRLTAQEIYSLRLRAELVVLSACRTAAGPVTGDGIVGLTRAFFYAGTPSVIATLWNLADVSGAQVMPAFYRAWKGETHKARALRNAQLALLARLRAGRVTVPSAAGLVRLEEDPFLWAGFVLLGEP